MGDFEDFAKDMFDLSGSLPNSVNSTKKTIALALASELISRTPVDTSQALSNWQVSVGSVNDNFLPPYHAGKSGSTYQQSSLAANQAAMDALSSYQGGDINIFNNAPYIVRLDQGYSSQAPAGFLNASLQAISNMQIKVTYG